MGRNDDDLLKEALTSADPDTAFCAALVLGDVDRLQAALKGDDLQKTAAGNKLISLGVIKPVIQEIPRSTAEIQKELVESLLRRKEPAPEAADALLEIVEKTDDDTLRERASRLLCRDLKPNWVLRIARAAKQNHHIYQNLLQAPDLPPEATVELADFLLAEGRFTMSQYGMDKLAENPALPPSYVPTRFDRADDKTKLEMLRFAEKQLEKRKHEGMHQFVMKTVFGPHPHEVRAAAWWTLHRWYRSQGEHRGEGPFTLTKEMLERFFGSVSEFLPRLAAVLRSPDTMKEVGYFEMIANVLRTADPETIAEMQAEGDACKDLLDALLEAAAGDYWPNTLESMIILASQLGGDSRWRDPVLTRLRGLGKKGNYHYDKALRRLELSKHGIPEESDWGKLGQDFVPSKFWSADGEGKRELLKLAEHQLIHGKPDTFNPAFFRFLFQVALKSEDPEIASEALEIHHERVPSEYRQILFTQEAIANVYGPIDGFLEVLPGALRAAVRSDDRALPDLLEPLFSRPRPEDAAFLTAAGEAGHGVVRAILDIVAVSTSQAPQSNLRRDAVRFLRDIGGPPIWRDEVLQALDRIRTTPGSDMVMECEMAIREIRPREDENLLPPEPGGALEDAPPPHVSYGAPEPEDEVVDYVAKQKIAERMGVELQAKMMMLMAGPGTPDEKMREGIRLSEQFQAAIKKLYGQ
jgi:hypothetical protein